MNLLLIDNDPEIYKKFKQICEFKDYSFFKSDYTFDQFETNNIDVVVIEFNDETSKNLLNRILEFNPLQNIIIISEILDCNCNLDCEICSKNHNKIRLLKPLNITELVNTIENFELLSCKYKNTKCFKEIYHVFEDIISRFNHFDFNQETLLISGKNYSHHLQAYELFKLIEILEYYKINFKLVEETNIQLFS